MQNYYVYFLINPITQKAFYVGKGKGRRAENHLTGTVCRGENKRKDKMISKIREAGEEPVICKAFTNLMEDEAYHLEEYIIDIMGRFGLDEKGCLMNFCKSNRPPNHKGLKRSEETKEKLRNRKWSEETRKKLSAAIAGSKNPNYGRPGVNLGKKFSKEHREKLRQSHLGNKLSEQTKRKLSESKKGRAPSPQTIAASVAAKKGVKANPESIAKMVETRKKNGSYKRTPESIQKMKETNAAKKAIIQVKDVNT